MSENMPTPETREDNYLAAVGGATVDLTPYLPPRTRREKYLYEMAGGEVERPDPISREDHYMIAALENGGGSGPAPTGTISIDSNGTYDVASYASASVEVPGELTDEDLHGVIFWDLDGNPLYRYTLDQIQSMESLPPVPDAPDVEARPYIGTSEWNWTLAELKAAAAPADVGPLYHLHDGIAAVLPIEVGAGDTISVTVTNSYASANIDWGDGTSGTIGASSTQVTIDHVYGTAGRYGLVISGIDGSTSGNLLEISAITPRAVAAAYLGKN